ncbi:adhesion G protein-coupled receptor F5-like [Cebidichthys violaceus]|uniref:adhesion G protein-coupled receptor F5-like n=1 Tax=Cebidichthys violaceus TaxID=271503 RepID=UPI0035CADB1F
MALSTAAGFLVVLLVIYHSLHNQGYRESLNLFFEELVGTKASHTHAREKRVASLSSSNYVFQVVINTSDLASLQTLLSNLSLPQLINTTSVITSINTTTVCSLTGAAYQCRCEESYTWSYNSCVNRDACDDIIGDTCGCISALPADDQYCQPNVSRADPVDIDIVLDLRIPVSSVPSNFIQLFRNTLTRLSLPHTINQSLKVIGLNFTTGCFPNSPGELQCECEEQFAWSCDKCHTYGACSNATNPTCGCINGLPSDGEFCEPITNVSQCSVTETATTPMTTTTMTNTTTPMTNTTLMKSTTMTNTTTPMNSTTMTNTTTPMMITTMMTTTTPMTNTILMNSTTMTNTTTPINSTTMTTTTTPINSTTTTNTTTTINSTTMTNTTTPMNLTMTTITTPMNSTTTNTTPPMDSTTMTNTTTQMNSTTMTNTTTQMNSTTMTTTTTSMTSTTMTTTTITEVRNLSFTMDLTFDSSYNNPTHSVYRNVYKSIEKQSRTYISTFKAVQSIEFQSGSTICNYALRATSFQDTEINAVKAGIFTELSENYTMFYDSSTALVFDPIQVLFGRKVTVTCGPPPADLNFSTNWTAEWKRDNDLIRKDNLHEFSNGGATLTVLRFFSTDNGLYKCTLRRGDKSAFRQRSNGEYKHRPSPLIEVSPVRRTVRCPNEKEVLLNCSVNSPFEVEVKDIPTEGTNKITYRFPINCANSKEIITCQVKGYTDFSKAITLVLTTQTSFLCEDEVFGVGNEGDVTEASCEENEVGEKTVVCGGDGLWRVQRDSCILGALQQLLEQSEFLNNNSLPTFLKQLSDINLNSSEEVVESPANINAVVDILINVANLSIPITKTSMRDILLTTGVLTTDGSKESWDILNTNARNISVSGSVSTKGVSSTLLLAIETLTSIITNDSFDINTPHILLNKTTFTDNFNAEFNSSVEINVLESDEGNKSITVITFASMDNVLPVRDDDNSPFNVINGRVVLVQSSGTINNVSFTFDIFDEALGNPECVFWNFSLFEGIGGWDDEGCELVHQPNKTVTCNCNHLTSFSILMSPYLPDDPALLFLLKYITYIGVSISIASLVICLIIEAVIWTKIRKNNTSYLRHVSIVNIAVSLLIANIWFIIGAFVSDADEKDPPACTTATFFIHFFYLALFFWMLASGLLLLYRTVNVFDGGLSKKFMLAIGFTLGYGAPLVIAIITIAVTQPKEAYVRHTGCWLNWDQSKALLAFVVPVVLIVAINLMILLVVIYKMLRRRVVVDAAQTAERHVLVVIIRSLAVLTPFFGLTWGLGVGTMTKPNSKGIHVSFAFFNSLQGFFILVFGTLLDKKVRSEIAIMSQSSRTSTRSTSAGSSSGGLSFFRIKRRARDVYHVSSSDSGSSHSQHFMTLADSSGQSG